MEYRILFIEDYPGAYRRLIDVLAAHPIPGISYRLQSIHSFAAGQLQATRNRYHLVVAALRRRNGVLELLKNLRVACPDTRVLLLRDQDAGVAEVVSAKALGGTVVAATLAEPDWLAAVARQLRLPMTTPSAPPADAAAPPACVREDSAGELSAVLDDIRRTAHAELALYTDDIGHIIAQQGETNKIDLAALTSLVAGGFINALELGHVLRDAETQHFSIHEGRHYNVYSANVGGDRLLALVVDRQLTTPKVGLVMLLMKRGAEQLQRLRPAAQADDSPLDPQFGLSLNTEFDRVFGTELQAA